MIKQNFNRNWFFRDGCRDVFADLLKRDEAGCSITLPHDASIGRPRDAGVINGAANGYYQEGNYTYRKEFVIEEEHKEKNIYFEFEGVYQNAFVYINRSFAGKCRMDTVIFILTQRNTSALAGGMLLKSR